MTQMTATTIPRLVPIGLLLLLLRLPLVASFSPAAPPRFDVFCETIVGSWMTPAPTSDDSKPQSVDEVMRSCGGAVQGIKEMPCQKEFYLNRADDGFLFFDCGSYTHGPVLIPADGDSSNQQQTTSFMASLAIPKARIIVTVNSDTQKGDAVLYPKASFRGEADSPPETALSLSSKPDYEVERQLQCRMPSPSQPWMLQRVQWEFQRASETTGQKEEASPLTLPTKDGAYECWLEQVTPPKGGDSTVRNTSTTSMGVFCTISGYVKEIIRTYDVKDGSGKLIRVILQEGRLGV